MDLLTNSGTFDVLEDSRSIEIYNIVVHWMNQNDSRIHIAYGMMKSLSNRTNNVLVKASCFEGIAVYYSINGDLSRCFECLTEAFKICPTKETLYTNICINLWKITDSTLIKKFFEEFRKVHKNIKNADFLLFTMLSVVYQKSNDLVLYYDIRKMMKEYNDSFVLFHKGTHVTTPFYTENDVKDSYDTHVDTIDTILSNNEHIENIQRLLSKSPDAYLEKIGFHTSYMGYNTRVFQEMLSSFYSKLLPFLFYTSPHLAMRKPSANTNRLKRIGFVSAHLHNHSVGKLFGGVIKHIDRSLFETYVYVTGDETTFSQYATKYTHLPKNETFKKSIEMWRDIISKDDLDVLVYPDIGMIPTTYYLSFSRLAPVQAMWWGHTDTAATMIDYFISSKYFEDTQDQYTEKLIRHDGLSVIYERFPHYPNPATTREKLGLPVKGTIYMCVQTIFKWLPTFNKTICEILRKDPTAYIVGINTFNENFWSDQVIERTKRELGHEQASRVILLGGKNNYDDFMSICQHADVMLDTFPFGGTTTHLECFGIGKMAITLCSKSLPGSTCTGVYRALGLDTWQPSPVCHSVEEYVAKAIYYAHDNKARADFEKELLKRMEGFYLSQKEIDGWNTVFDTLTKNT